MDIKIIFAISIPISSKTKTDWFVQSARDLGSVKVARWESRSLSKHKFLSLTSTFIKPKPETEVVSLKVHLADRNRQ